MTADTLWVDHDGARIGLPLATTQIQVRTGGTFALTGFWWGLLTGAVVGGAISAVAHEPTYGYNLDRALICAFGGRCPPKPQTNSRLGDAAWGAARGALFGSLAGWAIGLALPKWAEVSATPTERRMSARLALEVG
jgi:hypothetical protein